MHALREASEARRLWSLTSIQSREMYSMLLPSAGRWRPLGALGSGSTLGGPVRDV